MPLPFFCVTCDHLRSDHAELSGACEYINPVGTRNAGMQCLCQQFVSPFLSEESSTMQATASEMTRLKACPCPPTPDQIAKLAALPNFNFAALIALLEADGPGALTLVTDLLTLFGVA